MALFNEMADIATKEFGKVGLIYLSISIFFCVYLIVIHWKKWKQNGWSGFVWPLEDQLGINSIHDFKLI